MTNTTPLIEPTCSPDDWNFQVRTDPAFASLPMWEEIRRHNISLSYHRDLGDDLSAAKQAILSRAVAMQVQLELADARMITGKPLPEDYTKLVTTLLRLLKELGLEKSKKAGANDLASYLAGKAGNDVAAAATPDWLTGKAI